MVGRWSRLLLASLLGAAPALAAAPAGGGAGGSSPSMSSSRYDAAAEYRKALQAMQEKRFPDARKAIEHVLAVAPEDANSNFIAGLASAGMGDDKAAKRFYERAVRGDGKDNVAAHRELGLTYLKLGDKAKAQGELDRLTEMQQRCGSGCAKAVELGGAVEALTKAMAAGPSARADGPAPLLFASAAAGDGAYLEAVSLINEGRYEQALASLAAARRAFGPHPDILTYQGFASRKLGRYETAERYYREALAAAPHHRAATEYFGELMVERGDKAGAQRMLADLETSCTFGCAEADELRRWIAGGHAPAR